MLAMPGPAPDVYLHIGAMKTGTSYLQQLLVENKRALADDEVLFPGEPGWGEQVRGVRDVLGLAADDEMRVSMRGAWDRLLAEIERFDGRAAVLSMEFMSFARQPRAQALVESLAPSDVHVILTVRDAGRVLPAQWQESTQNRGTASWADYTAAVLEGPESGNRVWRTSMRALNIPRMLSVWAPLVPPERLHVVLVPPPGAPSTLLWERFAGAVGVDPDRYRPPRKRRNESLGYASADLMRRANVDLRELPLTSYQRTAKAYLCKQVLAARTGEPNIPMTSGLAGFAAQWNQTMTEAIAATGGRIHGDLADLDGRPAATTESIEPLPQSELLDAASDAVSGLQQLVAERQRRLDSMRAERARADLSEEQPESYAGGDHADRDRALASWVGARDPVAAAVSEVVSVARRAAELRLERRRMTGSETTPRTTPGPAARARQLATAAVRRLRR
jgi:hypothetical protein